MYLRHVMPNHGHAGRLFIGCGEHSLTALLAICQRAQPVTPEDTQLSSLYYCLENFLQASKALKTPRSEDTLVLSCM